MTVLKNVPGNDEEAIQELYEDALTITNAGSGAGSVTLTTDELINGIYIQADGGSAATQTTPTAAQIVAAIDGCVPGTKFTFVMVNNDAGDSMTIAGGTGVTIKGTATTATGKHRIMLGVVTDTDSGSEAVSIYTGAPNS